MQQDVLHALWKLIDQMLKMERTAIEMCTAVVCPGSGAPEYFFQSVDGLHGIELNNLIMARNLLGRYVDHEPIDPYDDNTLFQATSENEKNEVTNMFIALSKCAHQLKILYTNRIPHLGEEISDALKENIECALQECDELITRIWQTTSMFINSQKEESTI